jgi:cytochrome P450
MNNPPTPDWDPRSPEVQRDLRAACDRLRRRSPVAYSELFGWSVFRHADVMRVLLDHDTFSSVVSRHVSVPNGMDPPEHTHYRLMIEPYFAPERMDEFEPQCRRIAARLVDEARAAGRVEFMATVAFPFAALSQCAFLGWPDRLAEALVRWVSKNQGSAAVRDREALAQNADEFEGIVSEMLEARRSEAARASADPTASLMREKVLGRSLDLPPLTSILRNWTVGEIGTISASVGIMALYLAERPALQSRLRGEPDLLLPAIDEMLRIHGPLATNRRVTTRPVEIGGRRIGAGEPITLHWVSANRDDAVFGDPDEFRLDRDPSKNLLYGAGIHVCPGAPLACLELRVFMEELLSRSPGLALVADQSAELAVYPASGYASVPLALR